QGGEQAPLPFPDGPAPLDHILPGDVGVEVGAGQEEHVLGPINYRVGVEDLAEAQRAATQQRPANGELAGLVLAEDCVALGDLEQGPEPRLQLRPVAKHSEALGGEGLAADGQLALPVLGRLGWWPAQPAGGGVGPVDALDRMGRQVGLAAGSPTSSSWTLASTSAARCWRWKRARAPSIFQAAPPTTASHHSCSPAAAPTRSTREASWSGEGASAF